MNDNDIRRLVDTTMIGEAVDSLGIAVFVTDSTLSYLAANQAAAEMLGCDRSAVPELRVTEVIERPEAELRADAARVEAAGLQSGTATVRRRDGSTLEIVYATFAGRLGGLPVLVSFARPGDGGALDSFLHAGAAEPAR